MYLIDLIETKQQSLYIHIYLNVAHGFDCFIKKKIWNEGK